MTLSFSIEPLKASEELLSEWKTLYARAEARSFFLSPPWISAWLSGRPEEVDLFVLRGVADPNPVSASSLLINAYVASRAPEPGSGLITNKPTPTVLMRRIQGRSATVSCASSRIFCSAGPILGTRSSRSRFHV